MILDDTVGRNFESAFLKDEAYWLARTLPELEWDDQESALLVEDIVGAAQMRDDS